MLITITALLFDLEGDFQFHYAYFRTRLWFSTSLTLQTWIKCESLEVNVEIYQQRIIFFFKPASCPSPLMTIFRSHSYNNRVKKAASPVLTVKICLTLLKHQRIFKRFSDSISHGTDKEVSKIAARKWKNKWEKLKTLKHRLRYFVPAKSVWIYSYEGLKYTSLMWFNVLGRFCQENFPKSHRISLKKAKRLAAS